MRRLLILSLALIVLASFFGKSVLAQYASLMDRAATRRQERIVRMTSEMSQPSSISSAAPVTPPAPTQTKTVITHVAIPILVYHHIRKNEGWAPTTWSAKMSVSPDNFAKQMQWLADHSYTAITLDTLARILGGEIAGPEKPVVITFDDNQRTAYTVAFPILKQHWFTAVYYLVTNRLNNASFITRDEVKELSDAGMDIESHTVTHAWLTRYTGAPLMKELAESKKTLEELTGKPVRHISYPSVMHNAVVRDAAREAGYLTGTTMDPRRLTEKDDWMTLPRIMMTDWVDLAKILP